MSKDEHTINVANKLINALARHCLWVGAAKVEAVLASKIDTARFVEDGIIIHLAVIRLKHVMGNCISLGI